ncbi:MAG: hypothetical protein K0S58_2483 [Nitrospira sp.]|nr:hypothetical protein [Nitrospira sp.]
MSIAIGGELKTGHSSAHGHRLMVIMIGVSEELRDLYHCRSREGKGWHAPSQQGQRGEYQSNAFHLGLQPLPPVALRQHSWIIQNSLPAEKTVIKKIFQTRKEFLLRDGHSPG